MKLGVQIARAAPDDAATVAQLMQLYLHDFSEFAAIGSAFGELADSGHFAYPDLSSYWRAPGREALLIRAAGRLAGFVLVNDWSASGRPVDFAIAEFFVARKYRRHGIGTEAARRILIDRPGRWEIAVAAYNDPALAFWPKALHSMKLGAMDVIESTGSRWTGTIYRLSIGFAVER